MNILFGFSVLIAGSLFGFGLAYSTMVKPEVVLSFLTFDDFGLLWVLGAASLTTLLGYQLLPRLLNKPLFGLKFDLRKTPLDRNTILGAAIFGIGWGISGVCPGPALAGLGVANWPMLISVAGMFAGAYVHGRIMKQVQ